MSISELEDSGVSAGGSRGSYLSSHASGDEAEYPASEHGSDAAFLDDDAREDSCPMGLNPLEVFGEGPSRSICPC